MSAARVDRSPSDPAEAGGESNAAPPTKIACKRCRSLKARCPGRLAGSDKCAKCVKSGSECVVEQHKRGRKVGTRLSDPAKALMRMKSAFDIILNQTGKAPEVDIPEELSAMFASGSGSSSLPTPALSRKLSSTSQQPFFQPSEPSSSSTSAGLSNYDMSPTFSDASISLGDGLFPPSTSAYAAFDPVLSTLSPPDHQPLSFPSTPRLSSSHQGAFFPPPDHSPFPADPTQHLHPSTSHDQPLYAPPPPFPSQFKDLGPSSRSSPSLARLFALKSIDEEPATKGDLDLYRQDPVRLGYLSEERSRELFELFHAVVNPRICSFDVELHTHDYVRSSSQLLFSTILAVALKFSPPPDGRDDLMQTRTRCLALARDQVLRIVSDDGCRTVESVQALLLMVEYKEATDESAYLYLGMACRLAMDLDLGRPLPTLPERANRNRYRTLLNCFNADHRFAGCGQNFSKPTMMPEDSAVRNSSTFHRHPMATAYDSRLVAAVHLRRLLARYDTLLRANAEREGGPDSVPLINLRDLWVAVEQELAEWRQFWTAEIRTLDPNAYTLQLILNHEHGTLQIAHHWLFQAFRFPNLPWIHTAEDWEAERRAALAACIGGACRILRLMVTVPNSSLAYSPDTTHLFYSYATFLLAKLFRARLLEIELFPPASIAAIFSVIREAAEKLESATLDSSHTIALHAGLLRSILDNSSPTSSALSIDTDGIGFGASSVLDTFAGTGNAVAEDLPSPFLRPPSPQEGDSSTDRRRADLGGSAASVTQLDGGTGWDDGWLEEAMLVGAAGGAGVGALHWETLQFPPPN